VSVTKGMSTQRMVGLMAEVYGIEGVSFDFVLCIGKVGQGSRRDSLSLFGERGGPLSPTSVTCLTGKCRSCEKTAKRNLEFSQTITYIYR